MKTYIGTKTVNAKPMNRLEYNLFRGWQLPADENGADEGYLVEYTDGGKANTPQYAGYVSWSPKDVFGRAYHEVVVKDFKQRVIDEKNELDEKLTKLAAFLPTPACLGLPFDERVRLAQQHRLMGLYSTVLGERIEAFSVVQSDEV